MQAPSIALHSDLLAAQKLAFEPSGLLSEDFVKEAESEEYGAFLFKMNNCNLKFRVGKITPAKLGQFVTLWKRIGNGPILPHDLADPVDFFVVSVRSGERFGQFVFPKAVLAERGIVSREGKGGKRAMRVYPAWDVATSPQAKKTQLWQLRYFFDIKSNEGLDIARVQKLFLKPKA